VVRVVYSLAGKVRPILYQEPCYCDCDKNEGHKSLLDCFTAKHGIVCPTCQKEVIYVFEQAKAGKNAAQIRAGIENGEAWNVQPERYAEDYPEPPQNSAAPARH
jgi:hypothetical protein